MTSLKTLRKALLAPLAAGALAACGTTPGASTATDHTTDPTPTAQPLVDFGAIHLSETTPQAPLAHPDGHAFAASLDGHMINSNGKYHYDSARKVSRLLLRGDARLKDDDAFGGFRSKKLLTCGDKATIVTPFDVNTLGANGWDPKEAKIYLHLGGRLTAIGQYRKPPPGASESEKLGLFWHPLVCEGAFAATCTLTFKAGPVTDRFGDTYAADAVVTLADGLTYRATTSKEGNEPYAHSHDCTVSSDLN